MDAPPEIASHEREVFLADGRPAVVHGGGHPARAGRDDQPGCLAVDAVHEANLAVPASDEMPERVTEERPGRVDAQVAGLVDHQQVGVFVHHAVIQYGVRFRCFRREICHAVVAFQGHFWHSGTVVHGHEPRHDRLPPARAVESAERRGEVIGQSCTVLRLGDVAVELTSCEFVREIPAHPLSPIRVQD